MTKDEFLALPAEERKRLASVRSREIARARKAGQPIPPTLGEEFGDPSRKKRNVERPVAARAEAATEKSSTEFVAKPAKPVVKVKKEPGIRAAHSGKVAVTAGPGAPFLRTLRGMLHCVNASEMESYQSAAKAMGFDHKVGYFDGSRALGTIFFKGEFPVASVRATLVGCHPQMTFRLGEIQNI